VLFLLTAWKFHQNSDSKTSRNLFRFSLIHLPALMILLFVNKHGLWSGNRYIYLKKKCYGKSVYKIIFNFTANQKKIVKLSQLTRMKKSLVQFLKKLNHCNTLC